MDNTIDISPLLPDINIAKYAAMTRKNIVTIVDPSDGTNDTVATSRDILDIIRGYAGDRKELAIYTGTTLKDSGDITIEACTLVIFGKDSDFSIQCTFDERINPLGEIYAILKGWIKQKDELDAGDNNVPYEYTVDGHIYQYDAWFEDVIAYVEPLDLVGYPSLMKGIDTLADIYRETGDKLIKIRRDLTHLDDEAEDCWLTLDVSDNESKIILGAEDSEMRVSITGDFLSFYPAQLAHIHDGLISRSLPTGVNK